MGRPESARMALVVGVCVLVASVPLAVFFSLLTIPVGVLAFAGTVATAAALCRRWMLLTVSALCTILVVGAGIVAWALLGQAADLTDAMLPVPRPLKDGVLASGAAGMAAIAALAVLWILLIRATVPRHHRGPSAA